MTMLLNECARLTISRCPDTSTGTEKSPFSILDIAFLSWLIGRERRRDMRPATIALTAMTTRKMTTRIPASRLIAALISLTLLTVTMSQRVCMSVFTLRYMSVRLTVTRLLPRNISAAMGAVCAVIVAGSASEE